ncbi:deaminase [Paraburkholderia rhizosphaerae]|nr:deaminase [Paraburkholderia rhizosphaerae]
MSNELKLLFFYLLRRQSAGDGAPATVAGFNAGKWQVCRIGKRGVRLYESAAANIFCSGTALPKNKDNLALVMIGAPTEWELGLCVANQISTVYYLDAANNVCCKDLSQALSHGLFPEREVLGALGVVPRYDVNFNAWRTWYMQQIRSGPRLAWNPRQAFDAFKSAVNKAQATVASADPLNFDRLPFFEGLPRAGINRLSMVHRDAILMKLACALVGVGWSSKEPDLHLRAGTLGSGNNIGAVLTDEQSRIICWSLNVAGDGNGPTCHAECALVRALINKLGRVPDNCRLYTSLEPCYMCGGILATFCPTWKVYFGQSDKTIKNNALKREVNRSSQHQVKATSAVAIEKLYVDKKWGSGQTLKFLRHNDTRDAFLRLALVPDTMQQRYTELNTPQFVDVTPDRSTWVGRLGLDLPKTRAVSVAPIAAAHARRLSLSRDALDLATSPRTLARPRQIYVTGGGGLDEELALVTDCVGLLSDLLKKGYIRKPVVSTAT